MKRHILALVFAFSLAIPSLSLAVEDGQGRFFLPAPDSTSETLTQAISNNNAWSLYLNESDSPTTINIIAKDSESNVIELSLPNGFTGTAYTAGNGLQLVGDEFSSDATSCAADEYSYWSGSAWLCREDEDTTYTAGDGLQLVGGAFSIDSQTCSAGQYSRWTGSAWVCANDDKGVEDVTNNPPQASQILITGTTTKNIQLQMGSVSDGNAGLVTGDQVYDAIQNASGGSQLPTGVAATYCSDVEGGDYGNMWYEGGFIWGCVEREGAPFATRLNTLF